MIAFDLAEIINQVLDSMSINPPGLEGRTGFFELVQSG